MKSNCWLDESLSYISKCSVPEILQTPQLYNRMGNLHKIISDQYGMEVLHLLVDWDKLQIRDSNYRNHQIFILKCISKGITPVSIRLKTTVRTERARKIIRKAERDLLQARVKSINSLLDNNAKQKEVGHSLSP